MGEINFDWIDSQTIKIIKVYVKMIKINFLEWYIHINLMLSTYPSFILLK